MMDNIEQEIARCCGTVADKERMQLLVKELTDQLKDATRQCGVMADALREARQHINGGPGIKYGLEFAAMFKRIDAALAGKLPTTTNWPDKCPITRRDFFMEIDGVPTYGGPFDSYTIPEMLGTPEQPWHERELFVRRFDHDQGCWVDDEIISQRVIHDGVLDDLMDALTPATPEKARKVGGSFQHTGSVVARFNTLAGEPRIVLEFDAPVAGMLHIYRPDQVEPLDGGDVIRILGVDIDTIEATAKAKQNFISELDGDEQ